MDEATKKELRELIAEVVDEKIAERFPPRRPATVEEIGLLRDAALEAMTRRMPNHSNRPTASVYLLYEGAAAIWANLVNITPELRESLAAWLDLDRDEPMRPPHDPKAYLPLTTSDGAMPHPERFEGQDVDLDKPIPKETWPCVKDTPKKS